MNYNDMYAAISKWYSILLLYCLEDLWSSPIYDEIMESNNPQQNIIDFFAAKLLWDKKLQFLI